jgi:hypothetical protein
MFISSEYNKNSFNDWCTLGLEEGVMRVLHRRRAGSKCTNEDIYDALKGHTDLMDPNVQAAVESAVYRIKNKARNWQKVRRTRRRKCSQCSSPSLGKRWSGRLPLRCMIGYYR